jgi:hypothetical protein
MKKILETRKGSGSGNWKHDTFSFGLLWTKCRLSLILWILILPIVEKWAENVEYSFPCFDTPFIWPILFINVTKLICRRFFKASFLGCWPHMLFEKTPMTTKVWIYQTWLKSWLSFFKERFSTIKLHCSD